ncbi:MAG: YbhB/YbcL family Raf kinase inhibitor-like protein [Planctomycetota bacterium]|nr:YbhB/YbcL family Raf kinase inhibitor-like protein [Planctomycetota bacterium]
MAKQVIRKLQLRSPAFSPGERIPRRHARPPEGLDASPPLTWSLVPEGARELVLICDDPDAPSAEPWVHWVAYRIPAAARALAEGIPKDERPGNPEGMLQGQNSWGRVGYGGPQPPVGHGTHHYHFRLFAIDTHLSLGPGATKEEVLQAIDGHVLAEGELVGTYERLSSGAAGGAAAAPPSDEAS